MNDQELAQLSQEILSWLRTSPSDEDTIEYVKALEPNERAIVFRVVNDFLPVFSAEIESYLKINNLGALFHIDAGTFLYHLSLFALYSAGSVRKKLIEEKLIPEDLPAFPPDISEWANRQVNFWHSLTVLVGATEFLQEKVLLSSIESQNMQIEQVRSMQKDAQRHLELVGERMQLDQGISQVEQSEIQAFLKDLSFVPDETIQDFLMPERMFELQMFLFRVVSTLGVITANNGELPTEVLLLEQLRITYGKRLVDRLEALRLVNSGEMPAAANEKLYADVESCFSLENISSNQVSQALYNLALKQTDINNFTEVLYRFLRSYPRIDLILNPVSIHYLLDTIDQITLDKLSSYAAEIADEAEDERFKRYIPGLIQAIHYVVTSFKRASNV